MDNRAKALTIAVAITVLDFTMGGYCGPVIWQAWGGEQHLVTLLGRWQRVHPKRPALEWVHEPHFTLKRESDP
jgi:hypothetical protein